MKSVEFCYWLQGFFEISNLSGPMTPEQVDIVKKHLNMVFIHEIDPSYPKGQQSALTAAHNKVPFEATPEVARC